MAEIISFTLLAVLSFQLLMTYATAKYYFIVGSLTNTYSQTEIRDAEEVMMNEIWVRLLVPPPFRQLCYSTQPTVCQLTDGFLYAALNPSGGNDTDVSFQHVTLAEYLISPVKACISALLVSTLVVLKVTSRKPPVPLGGSVEKTK